MIRSREGGFYYSDLEFDAMKRDLDRAKALGFQGVIFGCLEEDGELNLKQLRGLRHLAEWMETAFHRAFDVVPVPKKL